MTTTIRKGRTLNREIYLDHPVPATITADPGIEIYEEDGEAFCQAEDVFAVITNTRVFNSGRTKVFKWTQELGLTSLCAVPWVLIDGDYAVSSDIVIRSI